MVETLLGWVDPNWVYEQLTGGNGAPFLIWTAAVFLASFFAGRKNQKGKMQPVQDQMEDRIKDLIETKNVLMANIGDEHSEYYLARARMLKKLNEAGAAAPSLIEEMLGNTEGNIENGPILRDLVWYRCVKGIAVEKGDNGLWTIRQSPVNYADSTRIDITLEDRYPSLEERVRMDAERAAREAAAITARQEVRMAEKRRDRAQNPRNRKHRDLEAERKYEQQKRDARMS